MQSDQYYELMDIVVAYIHVESLQGMQGFDSMIERIVNDNKLNLVTPKTLIALRSVYHKYMKFRADNDKRKG